MYNRVILVGNLTRDVEIRYTSGGSAIGKVGIATNRRFKSAGGEQKEEVMFIDLTFFGRTAEIANQYLRKGSKVLVEGRLVLEQWTAQDGSKRSRHSVTVENMQMLDSRGETPGGYEQGSRNYGTASDMETSSGYSQPSPSQRQPEQSNIPEINIDEDEIPF
jgi:single-strand DNA-binding protein